jgi:hypothetical protein
VITAAEYPHLVSSLQPNTGNCDDYENTKRQNCGTYEDAKYHFAQRDQKPRYSRRQRERRGQRFTKQTHAQSPSGNFKLIHFSILLLPYSYGTVKIPPQKDRDCLILNKAMSRDWL